MIIAPLIATALFQVTTQPAKPKKNAYRHFQTSELKTVRIKLKGQTFVSWVMDTNAKREEGMMYLQNADFTEKQAMIFVFSEPEVQRFWMKNTFVNLDIAYVNPEKAIVKTYTMAAFDTVTDYSSGKPAQYVIEFKEGVFKKLKVKAGDKVELVDPVKSKE